MVDPDKMKSTFMVNKEVYKRIRILALERNMEVSAIIEEAMREKLERDFPDYKPLPPMQHQSATSQPQQQQKEQPSPSPRIRQSGSYQQPQPSETATLSAIKKK